MKAMLICLTILILTISSFMSKNLKTKGECVRLNLTMLSG